MIGATIAAAACAALPPVAQTGEARTTHLGVPAGTLDGPVGPLAAAFGADGALWIAEGGDVRRTARVTAYAAGDVASMERGDHVAPEPIATLGAELLVEPIAIAADAAGKTVFVADRAAHRILAFDVASGAHEVLAGHGVGAGGVVLPRAVALDPASGALLVGDAFGAQILDPATKRWTRLPLEGVVRVDAIAALDGGSGRLVVADGARQTIEVFDAEGARLARLSEWGAFPGQVSSPGGVAMADGLAFVADTENHLSLIHI